LKEDSIRLYLTNNTTI